MKNNTRVLLIALMALSAVTVFADGNNTNKTFLQPRSHGVNLALEKTAGWPNLVNRHDKNSYGANIQATYFMMESTNDNMLANYFLFPTNANTSKCSDNCKSITLLRTTADATVGSIADLDLGFLVHNTTGAVSSDTLLKLCPQHGAIGVTFNYHQDLKCIVKGLYFEMQLPVVCVTNSLGMSTVGTEATNVSNFFKGGVIEKSKGDVNAFENLYNALISPGDLTRTSVADLDLILGYKFLDKRNYYVAMNIGLTVPTGNKSDGVNAFDAVIGNGGHLGFGFGLDARGKVWESACHKYNLNVNVAMNYRYLFEDDEVRTLGLTNQNFGQYLLLIDRTKQPNTQQLTPAANVTTLNVNVTPGSQFDGMVSMNYNYNRFAFDLGYNVFFRARERVTIAGPGCYIAQTANSTQQFPDNKWAVATRNAKMSDTVAVDPKVTPMTTSTTGVINTTTNFVYRYINNADLDTTSAQTPALTSHKIFGGVGYWTKGWEIPVLVGVGAHYEWADADLISNWGFNARVGMSF